MQRPGGDLVAAEAADPHALRLEPAARHLDQRQAAPLARGLGQREAAGVVAMQQRRLDRRAPGLAGVEPAGADMRPGLRLGVARRGRVDQRGAGGVDRRAAGDEVVGDRGGDAELPRRVLDGGDAVPLLGPGALGRGLHLGLARRRRRRRRGAGVASAVGATARVCGASAAARASAGRRRLGGRRGRRRGRSGGLRRRGLGLGFAGHGGLLGDGRRGAAQEMAGMGGGLGRLRRLPGGAEAGGGVGADRHGGELERLPVDGAPDRRLAVGLGDLVAADRVADRDVAHDAGGDVAPDRLDVGPVGEAHSGAADERLALAGDPGALDDADHVAEVPGAVGVEERRAAVQRGEVDVASSSDSTSS